MRILALVTDAYGAHGGIALCNRDIVESLTAMPEVTEVVVVPRNVPSLPERIPAKVRFVTKAAGGKGRYLLASLSLARRPRSLLFCGHVNLLPLATVLKRILRTPLVLMAHGIDGSIRISQRHLAESMT